jgi:hypothetical protein
VKRIVGGTEVWLAYSAPGVPAVAGDPLGFVASALDPVVASVVGQACVDLDGTAVRIIATRGQGQGIVAFLSTGPPPLVLSGVQNATSFQRGNTALLAGVEGTITGPRVVSFKLTNLLLGNNTVTGFVAVEGVETELATLPLSFAVADLDDDDRYDVLAALPSLGGPRIQANFGRLVAGEQLASVSQALDGGRAAVDPILRLEDVDGQGHRELVLMTDEGLDVLCFDVKPAGGGMECASALP